MHRVRNQINASSTYINILFIIAFRMLFTFIATASPILIGVQYGRSHRSAVFYASVKSESDSSALFVKILGTQ